MTRDPSPSDLAALRRNVLGALDGDARLAELGQMAQRHMGDDGSQLSLEDKGVVALLSMLDIYFSHIDDGELYQTALRRVNFFVDRESETGGRAWSLVRAHLLEIGRQCGWSTLDTLWDDWTPEQRREFSSMLADEVEQFGAQPGDDRWGTQGAGNSQSVNVEEQLPPSARVASGSGGKDADPEGVSSRLRDARKLLLGGLAVLAVGAASAYATGILPFKSDATAEVSRQALTASPSPEVAPQTGVLRVPDRWLGLADFLDQHEGRVVKIDTSLGGQWAKGSRARAGEFWPGSSLEGFGLSSLFVLPTSSGRTGYKTNASDVSDCDRWCGVDVLEGRTIMGSIRLTGYYLVEPSYKNRERTRESIASKRSGSVYSIRAVDSFATTQQDGYPLFPSG